LAIHSDNLPGKALLMDAIRPELLLQIKNSRVRQGNSDPEIIITGKKTFSEQVPLPFQAGDRIPLKKREVYGKGVLEQYPA
jgi:hypothetical protein